MTDDEKEKAVAEAHAAVNRLLQEYYGVRLNRERLRGVLERLFTRGHELGVREGVDYAGQQLADEARMARECGG
jgi:hypothetical protein